MNLEYILLCKRAYEGIIAGGRKLNGEEKKYIQKLHKTIFRYEEPKWEKIVDDIAELAKTIVKVKK